MFHARPALLVVLTLATALARAQAPEPSAQEWKLYREYLNAMEDEEVLKIKPEKRFDAIAKNFARYGTARKDLEAAIKKGEAAGKDLPERQAQRAQEMLDKTELKGRVKSLALDDSEAHTVAYITWRNEAEKSLEQEAALIAATVVESAPITLTLSMAAEDAGGRRVFQGKIDADRAKTIKVARIPMFFAKYMGLFDGVKNAYKGDVVDAAPTAAPAQK